MNIMNKKIRIVIADDHLLIAETWATLINMDPDFEVVRVFDNTQSLIEEISELKPDIAILDININPFSGIEATKMIRRLAPGTKIIGVSMHNQPSFAKKMMRNTQEESRLRQSVNWSLLIANYVKSYLQV